MLPNASQVFQSLYDGLQNHVDSDVADILRSSLFSDGKKRWSVALDEIRKRIGAHE
jgi:hypothetical protein